MRRSRVLVAAAGLFFALAVLWARVAWLSIGLHRHYEERAERSQEQRVLVRPVRGNLLDRQGRPLARDLRTYSIAVVPREMKDPRGTARRIAAVLGLDARALARDFSARPRYLVVARRVAPDAGQTILGWKEHGIYATVETQREYLLGSAAQEILGRTDIDDIGVEGLELQFDDVLRGRPGWTTMFKDGRGGTHLLSRGLRRSPTPGQHVVLSLDADLQGILESHLLRARDTLQAERAFGMFLDPRTGEILAVANVPHGGAGASRNWNFTDQYEPGSTFKMVVAGAALEEGVARPTDYLEAAASGVALVAPGCRLHDTHEAAGFTFFDAVRYSSNIVMARLALKLGPERYYRYATTLGFGSLTGVEFPGETGGKLRSPDRWSGRSLPTLAIGHEVTVTPLQLALAYAAVANGGVLMQPMLVREVRDDDGAVVRRFEPRAQRRVFSEATTATLRLMLASVVDSGTARPARVAGLHVAGKTGTAQKYDPRTRTYGANMFVSSFVGFAPAESPTLVGVIVIDEPHGRKHYGGEVAGPVFREVMMDLRRLPHGPLDLAATTIAARPPAPAPVTVPDLRLLLGRAAEQRLATCGLRAHFEGRGERALAQSPAAGQAIERGGSVTVWLSAPPDSNSGRMPDLAGLSVRAALRRLALLGAQARIEGTGLVVRQSPEPGAALAGGAVCRLWCEPGPAAPLERPSGTVAAVAAGASAP
jgi:cell division protein FtsI/penicillin-binding protein 2